MSSQHSRQQKKLTCCTTTSGTKDTETDIHIFAFVLELVSLFYKMYVYHNISPGLGLQCVIVVFLDDTHLFFWSLVEKEYKSTTADTERVRERRCCCFLFKYMLVNSHLTPPTRTL